MVIDSLMNASRYTSVHPGFTAAFRFLAQPNLSSIPEGSHPIDGQRVYALVQEYTTKPQSDGFLEAHRKYIDIQYIVLGEEGIGYAPLTNQAIQIPYDGGKDIAFFRGPFCICPLLAGMFAIFFPSDAHLPSRTMIAPSRVRKIVVKVNAALPSAWEY